MTEKLCQPLVAGLAQVVVVVIARHDAIHGKAGAVGAQVRQGARARARRNRPGPYPARPRPERGAGGRRSAG